MPRKQSAKATDNKQKVVINETIVEKKVVIVDKEPQARIRNTSDGIRCLRKPEEIKRPEQLMKAEDGPDTDSDDDTWDEEEEDDDEETQGDVYIIIILVVKRKMSRLPK